jgi:hypothetical protein
MLPFWFASPDLLIQVRRAEIDALNRLLAKHPDLRNLFDSADATVSQRSACFELLVRVKLVQMIDEPFIALHEQLPSLSDVEAATLRRTHSLVPADAPTWVSEMHLVVQQLPAHLNASLPEPLRTGGYRHDNPQQNSLIESAVEAFSSVEQLQALIERVLDQQSLRLVQRWSATQQPTVANANRLKGTEGLVSKNDLSRYAQYMDNLTEKQHLAFLLRFQYGLGLAEIAKRMGGIDRKTADEHIKAAKKKVEQARSNEKGKVRRAKNAPEF